MKTNLGGLVRLLAMLATTVLTVGGTVIEARAEVAEKRIEYKSGTDILVGYVYSESGSTAKGPGVIVFSDWMGVGSFSKERARQLTALGYSAFVADIYGNGLQAKDAKEAGELAGKFKKDRELVRRRADAALKTFLENAPVDPAKVGAIGFCFGGMVALELGRSGAPLAGIVSFHGSLDTPDPSLTKSMKAKVLVLHGADDPFVPGKDVEGFEKEMNAAGVSWELVKYSGAVHAFTNPAAGNDKSKGAAYNELVSKRSYRAMEDFFREVL